MDEFEYRNGALHCERMAAADLAERFGTPLYVYSQSTLLGHYDRFREAFAPLNPLICFSIKSCQNIHICRLLRERGSGFDVVSGGELYRALQAGAEPGKIVFAGVGKTVRELGEAFDARIGLYNVESLSELEQIESLAAQRGIVVDAALRVNPDVDAGTHRYTTTGVKRTKFGVDIDRAAEVFGRGGWGWALRLRGIHVHIGSPVFEPTTYRRALERVLELRGRLRRSGIEIDVIDVGGGFGAHYRGGESPTAAAYAEAIVPLLMPEGTRVVVEPGRSIAGNAGVLLTRVLHTKESGGKRFAIVDAAMTELIRPALYGAYHFVWPADAGDRAPAARCAEQPFDGLEPWDVVGPVCESADFLAQDRMLPPLKRGDLLAVFTAGAYAMTMSSQYNSRPRAAEVLVTGGEARMIRRRETYEDLIAAERT